MINVIPAPKHCRELEGVYVLPTPIRIKTDFSIDVFNGFVKCDENENITVIADNSIADEGYKLSVKSDEIVIRASTQNGFCYAVNTLRKLGNLDLGENEIPCCEIEDEPRFSWRGLEIDESRHFFGMDEIKKILDMMFLEKLNVFHWHLTDDQGWRIEIKKYPLLTEIGSKRKNSQVGGWKSFKMVNKPHCGFYTQEQIKEIIEYAKNRGIMIVPEIDFPAHCASALAPYKYLACREIETEVPGYFGGIIPQWKHFNWSWNRTVCLGKESTFEFIFNVLDEVCELFDAPYLHMGGDEAPQGEWNKCDKCQAVMKQNGLKNESELQGWFENRISDYLKTKGKKLIAWNDVLKADNLNKEDKNFVVQYWTPQRDKRCEAYVNSGGEAILSNHQCFYFDMTYAQIPLDKTYSYNPEEFGMNADSKGVLGYEGELWTEWIEGSEKLEMNAFPRMQALAEVSWSPKEKIVFDDFKKRLDMYKPWFDKYGINYACDKVAMAQTGVKKSKVIAKFMKGNPNLELELNKEYKSKGER